MVLLCLKRIQREVTILAVVLPPYAPMSYSVQGPTVLRPLIPPTIPSHRKPTKATLLPFWVHRSAIHTVNRKPLVLV